MSADPDDGEIRAQADAAAKIDAGQSPGIAGHRRDGIAEPYLDTRLCVGIEQEARDNRRDRPCEQPGAASITVTFLPSLAAEEATSSPMNPPPTMTISLA